MGLKFIRWGLKTLLGVVDQMIPPPPGVSSAVEAYEGPDDIWPPEPPEITSTSSSSELLVTKQYGLRLPNGAIVWNAWNDPPLVVPFDNPLDRLRMVANLQKTAADVGFDVADFLAQYGWVTRNQIATVVYEDTGSHALTDRDVCGVSTSSPGETPDGSSSDPAVRQGPVGGDEQ